ncbi:hypothetical protein [Halorubrum sp. FL23]|uniref:hypothetical protein n=1 Tax=Halorubrum sp. FL23 TaxID=3458704 RepID=UPI004033709B
MTPPLRRRRLLAAAVPGLLAGCLVESSADAGSDGGSEDGTGPSADDTGSDTASDGDRESLSGDAESAAEQTDDGDPPEEVGPDGAGLAVTNVDVLSVTDGKYDTTVLAVLTVENAGRFTYGTVELRADAYATRPNSAEREAVGYAYEYTHYPADDRFTDGTRRITVEISFRSRSTRARPDPDWYEVDAAIRRAEPV